MILFALLLVIPELGLEQIRQAIALGSAPDAERTVVLEKYMVRFPAAAGEHAAAVQVFTPFRDVMERAVEHRLLGNTYGETEALNDAAQHSPALRIVVRVVLPPNRVPMNPLVPLGRDFRVLVAYRPEGLGRARAVAEPAFTVTETCRGVPCYQHDASTDGALLEVSVPLSQGTASPALPAADPQSLLTVTVVAPSRISRTARFNLAELR